MCVTCKKKKKVGRDSCHVVGDGVVFIAVVHCISCHTEEKKHAVWRTKTSALKDSQWRHQYQSQTEHTKKRKISTEIACECKLYIELAWQTKIYVWKCYERKEATSNEHGHTWIMNEMQWVNLKHLTIIICFILSVIVRDESDNVQPNKLASIKQPCKF